LERKSAWPVEARLVRLRHNIVHHLRIQNHIPHEDDNAGADPQRYTDVNEDSHPPLRKSLQGIIKPI
jgi:hypothetical protein